MKVESKISLHEKHGEFYARWRSDEIVAIKNGKPIRKQHNEPTRVPVPLKEATPKEIEEARQLAWDVAAYMAALTSNNPPPEEVQQYKLKEFALRLAKTSSNSLRKFVPLFLIDYATSLNKHGTKPLVEAVSTMIDTWEKVLDRLGPDRNLHPSLVSGAKLQSIVNQLPGDTKRHAINVKLGYKHALKLGWVIKGHNPAEQLEGKPRPHISRATFTKEDIQRGLAHMATVPSGDQWQIVTLLGIYSPMRFLTACRLKLKPVHFDRPEDHRVMAFLDTSGKEWFVEYNDTKAHAWKIYLLDDVFCRLWLKPYIKRKRLQPGDCLLEHFATVEHPPCERWQQLMTSAGVQMVYSKKRICRTGYHALRKSKDKWLKEGGDGTLTTTDVENVALSHHARVHRTFYESDAIDVAAQHRINRNLPKFIPTECNLNAPLFDLRENIRQRRLELEALEQQEQEIVRLINSQNHHAN